MAANGSYGDKSQLPLAGVILCCTSILPERRSELSAIAAQMGAASKLDLTSDVTHLIVGDVDTPKYKYVAKERPDVVCLSPDWVYAVREAWMEGGELDIDSYEQKYKCPTFMGLRICVTGFEDLVFRRQIEETAKAHGADYKGDLSKETTHLIARIPSGAKYTHAKIWGVKVVSIEWFQQSLERGMVLDESLYDPSLEESERGRGAWIRRSESGSSLGKRRRTEDVVAVPGRMLRRSASSKYDSQNDGFWSDITTSIPRPQPQSISEWEDINTGQANDNATTPRTDQVVPKPPQAQNASKPKGMFHGKKFYLHGFDLKQSPVLQQCLASHDAELVSEYSQETQQSTLSTNSYLVVPHNSTPTDRPSTQDSSFTSVVTEFWVEKCLYKKESIEPSEDVLCNPFQYPIPGFEEIVITSTAFEGIELLHLNKAVKLLGARYDEFLTRKASVLICNEGSVNREKIKAALEWRIPAVKSQWLWDSMRTGQVKDVYDYLVYRKAQQRSDIEKRQEASKAAEATTESVPRTTPALDKSKEIIDTSKQYSTESRREPSVSHGPFAEEDDPPRCATPEQKAPSSSKQSNISSRLETRLRPDPLKERSPNSPTAPPISPSKSDKSSAHIRRKSDRDALSDAITSLLAQTKNSATGTTANNSNSTSRSLSNPTTGPETRRRNRKLLGRAASNLSARSGGSNNANPILNLNTGLSRASSVGTMNTDDVGTPIDLSAGGAATGISTSKSALGEGLTASALTSHDELLAAEDDGEEPVEKPLQMTQVGYEDPEAGRWRARLMRKVGAQARGEAGEEEGKISKGGGVAATGGAAGGTLEDEGEGQKSVSTRTRRRTRGGGQDEEVVGIEWE